jgi:hypothetical protein
MTTGFRNNSRCARLAVENRRRGLRRGGVDQCAGCPRGGRCRRDPSRKCPGFDDEVRVVDAAPDQTPAFGLLRADPLTGQAHAQCACPTDMSRQDPGGAGIGRDAERSDLGDKEVRRPGGDGDVGEQREPEAAAGTRAVHRGDHRDRRVQDRLAQRVELRPHDLLDVPAETVDGGVEVFQVCAAGKRAPRTREDECRDPLGGRGCHDRRVQTVHRLPGQRVEPVRPVDGDRGDAVDDLDGDHQRLNPPPQTSVCALT